MGILTKNTDALQRFYPGQFEGEPRTISGEALVGFPVWVRGAVKIFALYGPSKANEPLLYLVRPEPAVAFEFLMRIYRQLVNWFKSPVLISADHMVAKHRPLLVKFGMAFIFKNESIYAPELGLKFGRLNRFREDRSVRVENIKESLSPFALKLAAGILTRQVTQNFTLKALHEKLHQERVDVSMAKLSLALKELVEQEVLLASGAGPTRSFTQGNFEQTWERLLALPLAAFFREAQTNHVPGSRETFCLAGETALAQYSNLAANAKATLAMSVKEFRESYDGKKHEIGSGDATTRTTIQIWKEPPHLFAIKGALNPVELFFSLQSDPDERVQIALDEMLQLYGLRRKKE